MVVESADLKIERAVEHVAELNELFRKQRPFSYILETNTQTAQRATCAKKNEAVIQSAALICGDAVHNLHAALDHAYWHIVSPFAIDERQQKAIQFPFSKTAAGLDDAIKIRLADRVSPAFLKALRDLNPHGEAGGNELLYLIQKLDVLDKHRLLIPTGDYTRLSSEAIRAQVPDFPGLPSGIGFSQNRRDVVWPVPPSQRRSMANLPVIFEQELDVPVEIIFAVAEAGNHRPMVATLHKLIDVAKATIAIMRGTA